MDGFGAQRPWQYNLLGVPSAKRSTRSTRTPGSPNNNVVPSVTALGFLPPPECFATFRLQKAKGLQLQRHAHESEITTARLNLKSPTSRAAQHEPTETSGDPQFVTATSPIQNQG